MIHQSRVACRAVEPQATVPSDHLLAPPQSKPDMYKNVGPAPQRFSVGDGMLLDIATAALPVIMRLGSGALCYGYSPSLEKDDGTGGTGYTMLKNLPGGRKLHETSGVASFPRPAMPLELYEFESCPFCKKVREAVSILDLDVMMFPVPQNGEIYRPRAKELGGKAMFPYLVDKNTGKSMYESDDIIAYLFDTYGPGKEAVPLALRLGFGTTLTAGLGLALRAGKGGRKVPSRQPAKPLVFWGYDGSPFVKVVREVLCEMELPYLYKNAARGSPKRQQLVDKYGTFQVPLLEDPNTESYLFESKDIIKYLKDTYGMPVSALQ